jgi:hypothetical protein
MGWIIVTREHTLKILGKSHRRDWFLSGRVHPHRRTMEMMQAAQNNVQNVAGVPIRSAYSHWSSVEGSDARNENEVSATNQSR